MAKSARTKSTSRGDPNRTPAMRQHAAFKRRHPDCLLFFRMGDFYELFHDDAVEAHRVLGITLTERTEGVPMAGVPAHSVESYLRKAIEAGYRVAVADQVQDPKEAKGVVERAVTRVLTPGTLVDESLLDDARANRVGAILFTESGDHSAACLAAVEVSTGSFLLRDAGSEEIPDEVLRLGLSELLHADTASGDVPPRVARVSDATGVVLTARPAWQFRHEEAFDALCEHFGVASLAGFGLDDADPALAPAGALLRFLAETQAPDAKGPALRHVRPPRRGTAEDYLRVDLTSLRSLEIERTMRSGEVAGSLLGTLQTCVTPMGKRLLREWLCHPLRDREAIEARQRAVGRFARPGRALRRVRPTDPGRRPHHRPPRPRSCRPARSRRPRPLARSHRRPPRAAR